MTHCGVGTHHQNGIAKRFIKMLGTRGRMMRTGGRTMLQRACLHWSEAISVGLWPHALKLACHLENHNPGPKGLSKAEKFAKICAPGHNFDMKLRRTFGCPVFVLKAPLQSGRGTPCWDSLTVLAGLHLEFSESCTGAVGEPRRSPNLQGLQRDVSALSSTRFPHCHSPRQW